MNAPKQLGRYQVVRVLGRGAMGEMYEGLDPRLNRSVAIKVCAIQPGDLYLLCSDGLYGSTPHAAIQHAMAQAHTQSLDACCAALIDLAKRHGSRDNITALLVLADR